MNAEYSNDNNVKYVDNLNRATAYYRGLGTITERTNQYTLFRCPDNKYVRLVLCPKHLTHIRKESPCKRCHKHVPDHALKYDDEYLQEEVCRSCAGFRQCEMCYKTTPLNKLMLNEDNYLACKMCNDHERARCDKCRDSFYKFELNYVPSNLYFCDACEETHNEEYDYAMEYNEYD